MTFNVISDLHCNSFTESKHDMLGFDLNKLEPADYLIIAGDLGLDENCEKLASYIKKNTEDKFNDVLWIKGNHDYWAEYGSLKKMPENHKIDVVDGDVAIIGTTLWTSLITHSEKCRMNDYAYITGFENEKPVRFSEESKWLIEKFFDYKNDGKKVVIVTHHIPRTPDEITEVSNDHIGVSSAYWEESHCFDDIKPDLWVCGHIHENFDAVIDGVRFVRHPIGYRWGWYKDFPQTNPENWYNKIVEI